MSNQDIIAAIRHRAEEIVNSQDEDNREYAEEINIASILLTIEPYESL